MYLPDKDYGITLIEVAWVHMLTKTYYVPTLRDIRGVSVCFNKYLAVLNKILKEHGVDTSYQLL